jgi:acyl-CoA thioesterase I
MERVRGAFAAAVVVAACVTSCGGPLETPAHKAASASTAAAPSAANAPNAPNAPNASDSRPRVVCLGDSLTAGYGLPSPEQAYPALLEKKLREAGLDFDVINAGVSGDTSAGGLRRLDWSLQGQVRVLIVALGGNDGLRGLAPSELKANLSAIVEKAEARHIKVLLLGMEAPPNFGDRYTRDFRAVYRDVARERHVQLIPFFLNGVAGIATLNQADGIHPTAEGQRRIADTIWPQLKTLATSPTTS